MLKNKLNLKNVVAITICLVGATIMFAQETKAVNNSVKWSTHNMDSEDCSDNPIYKKMIALKEQYPEGMKWTNDDHYKWKGGIYSGGSGCSGFAFILSDAAFGKRPARKHYNFDSLRIGDIFRINNDTHSVVIICVNSTTVTLAEGNFNSSICWGRTFSIEDFKSKVDYIITRYPE